MDNLPQFEKKTPYKNTHKYITDTLYIAPVFISSIILRALMNVIFQNDMPSRRHDLEWCMGLDVDPDMTSLQCRLWIRTNFLAYLCQTVAGETQMFDWMPSIYVHIIYGRQLKWLIHFVQASRNCCTIKWVKNLPSFHCSNESRDVYAKSIHTPTLTSFLIIHHAIIFRLHSDTTFVGVSNIYKPGQNEPQLLEPYSF